MFWFPNTGHVIILKGTISLQFFLYNHVHIYVKVHEKTKSQIPLGPQWENKTHKLKKSIGPKKSKCFSYLHIVTLVSVMKDLCLSALHALLAHILYTLGQRRGLTGIIAA